MFSGIPLKILQSCWKLNADFFFLHYCFLFFFKTSFAFMTVPLVNKKLAFLTQPC